MKVLYLIFLIISVCYSCKPDLKKDQKLNISKIDSTTIKISTKHKILSDTNKIKIISGTFLGNEKRNFYGNQAPSRLKEIWRLFLGNGQTRVGSKSYTWAGAGWTGQPLLFLEDSIPFLIQGAYDHNIRKINALTGKEIWKYEFDDVIKSTGTIWINNNANNYEEKYVVLQGSRMGTIRNFSDMVIPSYRAISLISGKELWKLNSKKTDCNSRDVDGSVLIYNDTAYLGLENGIFTIFNPDKNFATIKDKILQPEIIRELKLYDSKDKIKHGGDLVTESSPARIGNRIYITSGSGHIYGYNLKTTKIDWDFFTGSDIDGSPVVTNDSCLIIAIEKQYIDGRGGALKLNPSKPAEKSVVWFCPTENKKYAEWLGGIIGSASVNDFYNKNDSFPHLAAFMGIDGFLYVVDHTSINQNEFVVGFDNKTKYKTPNIIFKYQVGPSISTPIFADNKLITCGYTGIYIFEFNTNGEFKLLDHRQTNAIEATPIIYKNRIYIASRDGFLYCYGNDTNFQSKSENIADKIISKDIIKKKSDTQNITSTSSLIKGKYYLIAGSFSVKSNAEKFLITMKTKGYKTHIIIPDMERNMVSIGIFDAKVDAEKKQKIFKEKGIDVWIYH